MTRTLTAKPLVNTTSDPYVFVPGPTAYPPLDPVTADDLVEGLSASAVTAQAGLFPGSDTYPGSDVYPGRGSVIPATNITPRTLTETPA